MQTVTLYATGECNLRCTHCSVGLDQDRPRPSLDTASLKRVLSTMATSGTRWVTILGGEATIYRQDLVKLLQYAGELGLLVSLNTNGIARAVLMRLAEQSALREVVVSLDGATATTHDAVRGRGTFARTTRTIQELATTPRVQGGELHLKLAHVLSASNAHEAGRIVTLANELGVNNLAVKHVRIIGRAEEHRDKLHLTHRSLLDAYSAVITTWLLTGTMKLDIQLPHALAYYLHRRFALPYPAVASTACGGTDRYWYVDLLGNHLPCPAMSYEEDPQNGLAESEAELNLVNVSAEDARQHEIFREFEHRRQTFAHRSKIFPCNSCRFADQSSPCTADLVQGADSTEVDLCAAVYHHGDEAVSGFRADVFPGAGKGVSATAENGTTPPDES
ncbi:radical SAM protein [Streptomyces sp. NPDC002446]